MTKTVMSEDCARELALYIENDYKLYTQYIAPYIQCLHKKREKARYLQGFFLDQVYDGI